MQDAIAIHWEAAAPRADHGRCAQQVEEIRSFHKRSGYSDIAYSWLVCNHGQIFSGRGWGRQSAATCNGHWNARAWSVCWMGGPGYSPTQEALRGIRTVVDEARTRGARTVIGHREACATECPGAFLMDWKNAGLPVSGVPSPTPSPQPPQEDEEMGTIVKAKGSDFWWFCRAGVRTHVLSRQEAQELHYTGQSNNDDAGTVSPSFLAHYREQARS